MDYCNVTITYFPSENVGRYYRAYIPRDIDKTCGGDATVSRVDGSTVVVKNSKVYVFTRVDVGSDEVYKKYTDVLDETQWLVMGARDIRDIPYDVSQHSKLSEVENAGLRLQDGISRNSAIRGYRKSDGDKYLAVGFSEHKKVIHTLKSSIALF